MILAAYNFFLKKHTQQNQQIRPMIIVPFRTTKAPVQGTGFLGNKAQEEIGGFGVEVDCKEILAILVTERSLSVMHNVRWTCIFPK